MAWDPRKDPIVGGNTATGERYTRSGLVISSSGNVRQGAKAPTSPKPGSYTADRKDASKPKPPPRPTSKPTPKPKRINDMKIRGQQEYLADRGYNVTVDGIEGPQTRAARKAFLNDVPSSVWNKNWAGRSGNTTTPLRTTTPDGGTTVPTVTDKQKPDKPKVTTKTKPKPSAPPQTEEEFVAQGLAAMTDQELRKFIERSTASQYSSEETAYNQAMQMYGSQMGNAAEASRDWADQIAAQFNQGSAAVQDAYGAAAQDMATTQAGVAGLFGGSTGAEAAVYGQPGQDLLAALGASDAAFSGNMQGILEAQQQDYARRAQGDILSKMAEAMASRSQSRAQQRSQSEGGLLDAYEARDKAYASQRALWQAEQMLPYETATAAANAKTAAAQAAAARANATVAQTEAANAGKVAKLKLKQAQTALQSDKLSNRLKQKQLADGSTVLDMKDPATIEALKTGIRKSFVGAQGGTVLRPDIAFQNALDSLSTVPGIDMKVARKLAELEIRKALRISHSKGKWRAWRWKDGKLFLDRALEKRLKEANEDE